MPCRVALFSAVLLLMTVAAPSAAQDVSSDDPPAHISFIDGSAVLERDGQPDASPANMPLLAGDRVRTEGGRLEILFADGSTLHLDAGTTVDVQSDDLVRLMAGRIRLSIPGPDRQLHYRIDAPAASVEIASPGEYRVTVLRAEPEPEVELAVLRGSAELVNEAGRTPLRAGQRAASRGSAAPSYAYAFNSASWDAFDRWSETRRDGRLGVSAQHLPTEVRPYAASFDRNGAWRYEASYGHVWYPTVSVGWRPYRNGRWVTLRPYGWTWVGADPWDWPTHHYGRWGLSGSAWFWIPGRSWAPAWVSWAYAPGYVSWCPLGWDNRPVVQVVHVYGRGRDPWRAWTAVPERHFGRGYNLHRVAARDFDVRTRRDFVARDRGPDFRGYAVPRSPTPIRIAGGGSSRRAGSPVYTNIERGSSRVAPGTSRTIVGPSRTTTAPGMQAPRSGRVDEPRGGVDPSRANSRGDVRGSGDGGARVVSELPEVPARSGQAVQRDGLPSARARERLAAPGSVRQGTGGRSDSPSAAPAPDGADNRGTFGGTTGRPAIGDPSRDRRAPAPYGQTPYGAGPRAVPRENPVYRPLPTPADRGTSSTTDGPPPPASQNLPRYGGERSVHEPPARRAPEGTPDGGARAVPRADPRGERPGPGSHPGPGSVERRGPAPDRAGAAPRDGGARSSGRGR